MRLLTITHYTSLLGANRSLLHLIEGLRAQYKVEILVFCPGQGPLTQELEKRGIRYVVRPFAHWAYTIRSKALYWFPWKWWESKREVFPELLEHTRSFRPDVIHSNSSVLALGRQLSEALGIPHVWHVREFGWSDYQLVYTQGKNSVRKGLAAARAVICISEAIRHAWAATLPHAHVIYNGIGAQKTIQACFAAGAAKQEDGLYRFLIIGQLQASKGQLEAIQAFAEVVKQAPNARLIVAGSGQRVYAWRLKRAARRLGIAQAVEFTGYVPHPAPLYASADAVLMCSRHEGMGRVTAEAMAYGKPVIGFNGGATPELILHGWNGLLYKNTGELVVFMEQLESDRIKGIELGRNGYQYALEHFCDERYVERFWEVIQNKKG